MLDQMAQKILMTKARCPDELGFLMKQSSVVPADLDVAESQTVCCNLMVLMPVHNDPDDPELRADTVPGLYHTGS